jgi:hypothetical protein
VVVDVGQMSVARHRRVVRKCILVVFALELLLLEDLKFSNDFMAFRLFFE